MNNASFSRHYGTPALSGCPDVNSVSDKFCVTEMDPKIKGLLNKGPINSQTLEKLFKLTKNKEVNKTTVRPSLASLNANRGTKRTTSFENESSDSSQQWQTPRKTARHKDLNTTSVPVSNNFDALSDNHMDIPEETTFQEATSGNSTQTTKNGTNMKNEKPPPINIVNSSINSIADVLITNKILKGEFLLKQVDDSVILNCKSMDIFDKVGTIFKSNNILFYTYTPKSKKPKNLVLKGINGNHKDEDILSEINEHNIASVKITKLSKIYFSKRKNPDFYHYLVQVSPDSDTNALRQIRHLAHQRIRWENLRRNNIFQCKNCQRVGHTSACCNLAYRCVKCTKSHAPGKCETTKDSEKTVLECVNCGEKGHPASYKGCPFLKYVKNINDQRNKKTKIQRIKDAAKSNNYLNTGLTYANALSEPREHRYSQQTQNYVADGVTNDQTYDKIEDLFNKFQASTKQFITQSLEPIKKAIDLNEKKINYLFTQFNLQWRE